MMIDPILAVYLAGALFALVVSAICLNKSTTFTDIIESAHETRMYIGVTSSSIALLWPAVLVIGAGVAFFWGIGWLAEKLSGGR